MGWFDDQIKERIKNDSDSLEKSYKLLANSVLGGQASFGGNVMAKNAIEDIVCYYEEKPVEPPGLMEDFYGRLDFMLRPAGIMRRSVTLKGDWYRHAFNPMIAFIGDEPVALLPRKRGGYEYMDRKNGRQVRVDKNISGIFSQKALCFYRPLPQKAVGVRELAGFILKSVSFGDIFIFVILGLFASLLGMVMPVISKLVFGAVIPFGRVSSLAPAASLALCTAVSIAFVTAAKELAFKRLKEKISITVDNAVMGRILNLPAGFFKKYNAGELHGRVSAVSQLCSTVTDTLFTVLLSTVFSSAYFIQIKLMVPSLFYVSAVIAAVQVFFIIASIIAAEGVLRKRIKLTAELNGLVFKLFSGIQKIKLAGAERRAFVKWAEKYGQISKYKYNPPFIIKIQSFAGEIIFLCGAVLIYYTAAVSNILYADYMVFTAAYGVVSGALLSLSKASGQIAGIKPTVEMARPVLDAVPENSYSKKMPSRISGGIEFSNVSFRYTEDSPYIVRNMNLKIKPGEYVAVVGRTGCGKSTFVRLLLGFEAPENGAVYYDNHDLQTLDLRWLRRNIGVVMQAGKLFAGDIYSNIVISAPWLSVEEAWEAARLAGISEDIKNMPMGMHTLISEGQGGISGGQRQRIMIARAIAPKPKILMLDEATSALDNITQKIVSDSLDNLKCTRIVVAHRLSTVKQCGRIIVLENGCIIEDGTYEELLNRGGLFSELANRQLL